MTKALLPLILALLALLFAVSARSIPFESIIRMPFDKDEEDNSGDGERFALLVAGSSGYGNYRHQADVCHAYQLMRSNGLKEENIVVMMYDDIASSPFNPRPGTIINHPKGPDVYAGVPKDYTGKAVNDKNLYAVLLGDKNATVGGSGKVIASGPNDRVFFFYSDHGGPGVLGMPGYPYVFANDLIDVLKKKRAAGGFKEMVIYLEACESGSIFEGLLPEDLGIYVTTAANAVESSWGTYCPASDMARGPGIPDEYQTCLGDLYSIAWMEDSEVHNLKRETIKQQYMTVKDRTSNHNTYQIGSHVMQYGTANISSEALSRFMGYDPANVNSPSSNGLLPYPPNSINQRDADLVHLWSKYKSAPERTTEKSDARELLTRTLLHRIHLDRSVELIGNLLFGPEAANEILGNVRELGKPLVDDWECLKSMVQAFQSKCGHLGDYGMKHMRAFANVCNNNVNSSKLAAAAGLVCSNQWNGAQKA